LKIARALHREGAWNNPKVSEGSGSQRIVVRESDKLFIVEVVSSGSKRFSS
jgi:hypothetical protein